jgi:hypothetical protein
MQQVLRKAARIKHAIAAEIGHVSPKCPDKNTIKKEDWRISRKPHSTIRTRIRLTITKMNKKKVTMKATKAQQAKPHPELDGVA